MSSHQTEFILESREHLAIFETSLLSLEKSPLGSASRALVDQALRAVHSLKGDAGFIGYTTIRNLSHAMESALEPFRDGTQFPPIPLIESLLLARDRLASFIEDLEHSQQANIDDLLGRLRSSSLSPPRVALDLPLTDPSRWSNSMVGLCKRIRSLGRVHRTQLMVQPPLDHRHPLPSTMFEARLEIEMDGFLSEDSVRKELGVTVVHELSTPKPSIIDLNGPMVGDAVVAFIRNKSAHSGRVGAPRLRFEPLNLQQPLAATTVLWEWDEIESQTDMPLLPTPEAAPPTRAVPITNAPLPSLSEVPSSRLVSNPAEAPSGKEYEALHSQTDEGIQIVSETSRIEPDSQSSQHHAEGEPRSPSSNATSIEHRGLESGPGVVASERLRSLRINVELLDRLMNLVGELTLVRNQAQASLRVEEGESQAILQRLNSVTTELQDTVLQTRMQPVGNLFGRFPRMVRDLARQLGKEVEVVTRGQEVELDKTVLERLSDPLTHLIRNSIDHGIETPEAREAANKPRSGKITLSAAPADGQVFIEIRDNGRGIDPNAIKAKAIAMRLRTEAELERMTPRELFSLILLPGFSTAKQVTEVSGRGVGMDVVRTNIEELEGTLSIDSILGQGTTISLRVPLTLAIVPCLIATCHRQRFAVPQRELEEIVCLHPGGKHVLEQAYDTEVFRLRQSLLPVVRLSEVLAHPRPLTADDKGKILARHADSLASRTKIEYLLVIRCAGKRFGLLVDDVLGREEIVVKPMHSALKRIGIFSGATMMGDGQVALIVHAEGIINHARCYASEVESHSDLKERDPNEVHRVLLFEYGPVEQFALPLVQVKRVELIATSRIDKIGKREYITIDGQSTLILRLSDVMDVSRCDDVESMFLILPKFVSEPMGILAHRIIDTESLAIQLQTSSEERGLLGTAIVHDKLSLFLDVQGLREQLFGEKRQDNSSNEEIDDEELVDLRGKKVLLVDDTPFFREVVRRYLSGMEMEIMTAVDGLDGLKALDNHPFDLVVSDIEMPNMNGWEFCKAARAKGITTPFVALTSLNKSDHELHAKECGFDDFEEKLDHDRLTKKVLQWLQKGSKRGAVDER